MVARIIAARRSSGLVGAMRANQWVARGENLGGKALDRAVMETLRHSARCIFDLYHTIHNPEAAARLIILEPAALELSRRPEFKGQGLMLVGVHLSNFDLVLQWLCIGGMRPLILTIPNPQGGRRVEFEMRSRTGVTILPASVSAMRQALSHLKQGGMVLTGIDRPIPDPGSRPRFFNRPAALPMHHIYLATKAQVPIVMIAAQLQADGKYHVHASELIRMEVGLDREKQALRNAEIVLYIAERYINHAPEQWSMSLPVWPEITDLVP